mgnify:CR=1 FL=1
MQYIGPRRPLSQLEVCNWINQFYRLQRLERARRVIAAGYQMVGVCDVLSHEGQHDCGFYFLSQFWGKGYASTACSRLLPDAVRQYGYHLTFFVAQKNLASHKLALKLGLNPAKQGIYQGLQGTFYSTRHIKSTSFG